jgi:hypothetical protein
MYNPKQEDCMSNFFYLAWFFYNIGRSDSPFKEII